MGSQSHSKPFQDFNLFPFFLPICFSFHPPYPCQLSLHLSEYLFQPSPFHSPPASSTTSSLILKKKKKKSFLGNSRKNKEAIRQGYLGIFVHFPQNHPHSLLPKLTWEEFSMQSKANPATIWITFLPPPFHSYPTHILSLNTCNTYLTVSLIFFNFLLCTDMLPSATGMPWKQNIKIQHPSILTLSLVFSPPFHWR